MLSSSTTRCLKTHKSQNAFTSYVFVLLKKKKVSIAFIFFFYLDFLLLICWLLACQNARGRISSEKKMI